MMWPVLAWVAFALAAVPAVVFGFNLLAYRRTPRPRTHMGAVSVLIPARNEEDTIGDSVRSALASQGVELEVVVLDDRSNDRTAERVRAIAATDPRVRLVSGVALPPGWCGKQFACHTLSQHAKHPWLVFLDADTRLSPDALARMIHFMDRSGAALGSGVPRQITVSFLERLLLPLIHFVLLGFLPIWRMRRILKPAYAAGCGQLFIARRDAYNAVGGHSVVRETLHDGLKLPRAFREAGMKTDLFDATDLAQCRMYRSGREVWSGLSKNAVEGLGAPRLIAPMTLLLLGGQVLPFALLPFVGSMSLVSATTVALAAVLALLPRWVAARRFQQPLDAALLHPVGVLTLLIIQWEALLRSWIGTPRAWKGRAYGAPRRSVARVAFTRRAALLALTAGLALAASSAEVKPIETFKLKDQFSEEHSHQFPRMRPMVILLADRGASKVIEPWIEALIPLCDQRVDLIGVADVRKVPWILHGRIRSGMRDLFQYPILLDWDGAICDRVGVVRDVPSVVLVDHKGSVRARIDGEFSGERLDSVRAAVNGLLREEAEPAPDHLGR